MRRPDDEDAAEEIRTCRGSSSGGTRDNHARSRARAAAQATPRSLRDLGRSTRRRRKKIRRAIIVMAGAIDAMPFCVKHSARSLPAAMP
jgi:hypothetical protein